ncbi:MAG TPA: hypothetical protein VK463_15625 [Desulfomonilaceae bacterium]|nr:hypothetical protein [Desulfomonilaceae bacterium]
MEDKEQRYWDRPNDAVGPGLPDGEEFFTKSLELTEWFNSDVSATGSFDVGLMVASSFGKLLDALPVPAMLIDYAYNIGFANQACGTISSNYKIVQGVPFASLVPRSRNSEKARAVMKKVFFTRKSVVAEGILEIDARKVWGRLYFRSIRVGHERYILLVIEDLTAEKTRLVLKQKDEDRQNTLISNANERLNEEVWRRERVESALKFERDKFRKLGQVLEFSTAIIGNDGDFRYISPDFKNIFGQVLDELARYRKNGVHDELSADVRNLLDWFVHLNDSADSSGTFVLKNAEGLEKEVVCRAARLENKEILVVCLDRQS